MAEALRIDELVAHSLATIGLAKGYLGDSSGSDDEARALEIAVAASSPVAGAIANNVAVRAIFAFDLRRASDLFDEGLRIAERLGDASGARWLRGQRASFAMFFDRWDEAARTMDEFVAECEAGSAHYLEATVRRERGHLREARGDLRGALDDFERAVALGRATNDPQELLPALGAAVAAFERHGHVDEARALARELVDLARSYPFDAEWALSLDFLFSREALAYEAELRETLRRAPHPRWKELAFACLDREFVRAAEIWAEGGSPTWEAHLRLRAAEDLIETGRRAEGEEQAARALAFYRSVGASYYIERIEALLAEAQSASA
jgi:tetratricopeptide (TPR) repeat protein